MRPVEVEYSEGHVADAVLRFVVVPSRQLAQQQTQSYTAAQMKEAAAVVDHVRRVEGQQFACLADADAAITDFEGCGQGRYHTVRYRVATEMRYLRRTRRGRPTKTAPPALETCYRPVVEVDTLANAEGENGWIVLATTMEPTQCAEAEILQVYQE